MVVLWYCFLIHYWVNKIFKHVYFYLHKNHVSKHLTVVEVIYFDVEVDLTNDVKQTNKKMHFQKSIPHGLPEYMGKSFLTQSKAQNLHFWTL